jgi:hypothetical protein
MYADQMETLANTLDSAQHQWQGVCHFVFAVVLYTMKCIDESFPTALSQEPFCGPPILIRSWNPEPHSPYSDDLGFR